MKNLIKILLITSLVFAQNDRSNARFSRYYKSILQLTGTSNSEIGAELVRVQDGAGNFSPLWIATDSVKVSGTFWVTGAVTLDSVDARIITVDSVYVADLTNLDYATATRLLATDGSKNVVSTDLNSWVTGTAYEVTIADDADGTITISLPDSVYQNLFEADSIWANYAGIANLLDVDGLTELDSTHISLGLEIDSILTFSNSGVVISQDSSGELHIEGSWNPTTDDGHDLGRPGFEWKDISIDGVAYIDSLEVHGNASIASHWNFKDNALTSLTDNNTTFTAFAGKAIVIESVSMDGGVVTGVTDLTMTGTIQGSGLNTLLSQGVSWDESADTYARLGSITDIATGQSAGDSRLIIQSAMRRCVLNDAGEVVYYLDASDSDLTEFGVASDLTGTDGQVMVEIPKFYYKYSYSGTTHSWSVSPIRLPGYNLHPAFYKNGAEVDYRYIGAYEGIGWDNGTTAYIDCGTAAANNWAGGAIDLANDKLGSVSGFAPMMDETRAEFRTIASNRGTGWRQQDFDLTSAIQLLYLVEYADFNSQSMIGMGRTELSGGSWTKDSYIGVTGKSNADGNGTGNVGGNSNNAYMSYRGIENFFGNIWKWVDGININDNVPYVSNDDANWADDTATDYTALGVTLHNGNGYQGTLEQINRGFLPASLTGGSASAKITDYYWQAAGWRVFFLGGSAYSGSYAGVFSASAYHASSYDDVAIGGRVCF